MAKKIQTTKKTEIPTTNAPSQETTTNTNTPTEEVHASTKVGSHGDKKILSIAIDPALHAKLALLARCEGRSVTDLVVETVSKNLKARIATALEVLRADLDK